MNTYEDKTLCCGCTACSLVCPKNAITMQEDEEGFLYPLTNEELCTNCGICRKVCAFTKKIEKAGTPAIYAVRHNDMEVLEKSSSGGVFTAISDVILNQGGVVYGASFDENYFVYHLRAANIETRNQLRGSKYVQSRLDDTYQKVKEDLDSGNVVLFSGTPCQNAGLASYLEFRGADTSNLLQCDLVCHGVPSPKLWIQYVQYLEDRFNGKITEFSFKDKRDNWKSMDSRVFVGDKDISSMCNKKLSFFRFYSTLYPVRPSCFKCPYTNLSRPSDLTIADFWNLEKSKPDFDDSTGVSLVLVNSEKGEKLFEKIKSTIYFEESNINECWQPHLEYPNSEPSRRKIFWREYKEKGFEYVIKKYGKGNLSYRLKRNLTPFLRKTGLYKISGKLYRMLFIKERKTKSA
jgi:coenzyme F420-reducing hydrogenase beta subunit